MFTFNLKLCNIVRILELRVLTIFSIVLPHCLPEKHSKPLDTFYWKTVFLIRYSFDWIYHIKC